MAFWVASPTMDPEIFALSVGLIGWPLAVVRLLATLALSLGAGYLTLALVRGGFLSGPVLRGKAEERRRAEEERRGAEEPAVCCAGVGSSASPAAEPVLVGIGPRPLAASASDAPAPDGAEPCCGDGRGGAAADHHDEEGRIATTTRRLRAFNPMEVGRDVAREGWRLGRWLLVAFALEAVILLYVPQEAIAGVLGGSNPLAVPLAALVGLPLYLNEAGALPIVAGLLEGGMSPGAAIAFLIAGPATTVPAMAAVWALVRPRVFTLYVGVALVGATALGLLTDLVL
jgi:uncharacterized membrane protein YraQ (UPF0718 family)